MNITINGTTVTLPSDVTTIEQLANLRSIPRQGSAIAINGKLIKADKWEITHISEGDSLLVISAAYGG